MAATVRNTNVVLSFADKRALLKKVTPQAAQPSGLRDAAIATLGGSVSSVRSFWDDLKTEYQFQEAQRKSLL